jgi:tripartite-type tricarboxylate transporter receptor subunit TctC
MRISHFFIDRELLEAMTGIKLTHVAYRGTALAMTDLLGGQIPVMFVQ